MTNIDRVLDRHKAIRSARDAMLAEVSDFLSAHNFVKDRGGSFVRRSGESLQRISFQKLTSGRSVRVIASVEALGSEPVLAPFSDSFGFKGRDGSRRYNFQWGTDKESVIRCAAEYKRYIAEVLFPWFLTTDEA